MIVVDVALLYHSRVVLSGFRVVLDFRMRVWCDIVVYQHSCGRTIQSDRILDKQAIGVETISNRLPW